jgi:hypothetical protein
MEIFLAKNKILEKKKKLLKLRIVNADQKTIKSFLIPN